MDNTVIRLAKEKQTYLETWLREYDQATQKAPVVRALLDQKKWEVEALSSAPASIGTAAPLLNSYYERELQSYQSAFPLHNNQSTMGSVTSIAATSGTATYDHVRRAGSLAGGEAVNWSQKWTFNYEELQERQNRREVVSALLQQLNLELSQEFDKAYKLYELARNGSGEKTSAANEMRNVLDDCKGALFEKARKAPKENMTWVGMIKRLSNHPQGSLEYQVLEEQEDIRSDLYKLLSDITKNQNTSKNTDLTTVYTELIDHLYTVLPLLKLV